MLWPHKNFTKVNPQIGVVHHIIKLLFTISNLSNKIMLICEFTYVKYLYVCSTSFYILSVTLL